jgi:CHAT domain-containing protein
MSLRFASGSDSLASALRDYQDRQQAYERIDDQWIAALGEEQLEMPLDRLTALRASRDEANSTLLMMADRLLTDFPDYMELASPRPIDVQNVRELLREGEAIVHFAFGNEHSHLFLVNRNDYLWMPLDIGRAELRQRVRKLRMALDPTAAVNAETGTPLLQRTRFDLELAYRLYDDLLGPVEKGLEAIDHLYFVPSDALTALPPAVLVTEPPRRLGGMRANNLAEWLIKRHAITVLPSVSSLKALRRFAGSERANRPFAGIGNPLLDASPAPGSGQRGIGSVFEGSLADPASLKKLGNLPQTEREIRQLASLLGAGEQDLFLGEGANETRIKQYKLDDYRIVAFATHGLLAGELEGQSEPGLVLTPPTAATRENDGLLTASEIARMRFNADWVILSACNTAAGDAPGADGLSGLARAFFYAGARTLLVSHWPVGDRAALRLTTGAIRYLQEHPSAGKSEAFRQSMLQLLGDRSNPWNAHPRTWAPFVVVGENISYPAE